MSNHKITTVGDSTTTVIFKGIEIRQRKISAINFDEDVFKQL